MGDCATCSVKRRPRPERLYYGRVPRQLRYSSPIMESYYRGRCNPCDTCCIATGDGPCGTCRPVCAEPCSPCGPCADPRCCYCTGESETGILHTIRNGFQRIFTGGKKRVDCCEPLHRDNVYRYSISQLKNIEQCLEKLEDETHCIEEMVKDAYNCDYRTSCDSMRCSLNTIMDRSEEIKADLMCAYNCYDPCRDHCEYETICSLLDRVNCLQSQINDLCFELDCLECQGNCYPGRCDLTCRKPCCVRQPACKPNCRKPCCYRPLPCYTQAFCKTPCDVNCRKPCCAKAVCDLKYTKTMPCEVGCRKACCVKPTRCRKRFVKDLCRTSSAIPVGVMLVKL